MFPNDEVQPPNFDHFFILGKIKIGIGIGIKIGKKDVHYRCQIFNMENDLTFVSSMLFLASFRYALLAIYTKVFFFIRGIRTVFFNQV